MFSTDLILPLLLLLLVNFAVIFRRIRKLTIPAWTAFLSAALILIFLDYQEYDRAVVVISNQGDVFVFLFGMFVVVNSYNY